MWRIISVFLILFQNEFLNIYNIYDSILGQLLTTNKYILLLDSDL